MALDFDPYFHLDESEAVWDFLWENGLFLIFHHPWSEQSIFQYWKSINFHFESRDLGIGHKNYDICSLLHSQILY